MWLPGLGPTVDPGYAFDMRELDDRSLINRGDVKARPLGGVGGSLSG